MSGVDIILNTFFNNPNLPVDPPIGFYDNFDRANGPIGVTSNEAKPWIKQTITAGDGVAVIDTNKAAPSGTTGAFIYAVDALSGNGTLSTVVSTVSTDGGARLVARCQDYDNCLLLTILTSAGRMTLVKKIAGVSTTLADVAILTSEINDKLLEIVLSGSVVSVKLDGATKIAPVSAPELQSNTKHGFFFNASQSKTTRYDDFRFKL